MGFMTGEKYQCQECDEILVMPIEFDNVEDYLIFLKVQSPEKFKEAKGNFKVEESKKDAPDTCLLYTSPSPRDATLSRMPSSA